MMYRVPRPSRSNGVKLHTLGDHEIGIEYTVGEPHVGKMAYDSSCGIHSRNITFRRPDIDKIIADAVSQVDREDAAMMPKAGINRSMKTDAWQYDDDNDTDAAMARCWSSWKILSRRNDLEIVQALFCGAADVEEAGEAQAMARRDDDRRTGRQAADAARRRPLTAAAERKALEMFPHWNRLS